VISFKTTILQFAEQGEKTGWTYVEIPADLAQQLKPGNKKSFRVRGKLDGFAIAGVALLPMGEGNFIMPLNATMRKNIHKGKGAILKLSLEEDPKRPEIDRELMQCLKDEPGALLSFKKLNRSHQLYYSKWIQSAKTSATKTRRIAQAVSALGKGFHYGQMMRWLSEHRNNL
jgi:hypothetical protein